MPAKPRNTNDNPVTAQFALRLILRVGSGVVALLVLLALVSYSPDDTQLLAGGLRTHATLDNWIGFFGAYLSKWLIEWFGFASYFGIVLVFVCIVARLSPGQFRTATPVYLAGIVATIWGTSMFIGIFPNFLSAAAEALNITRTPGGAIGNRFCAPWSLGTTGGWLSYVVHPAGSAIISLALTGLGIATVWYFDWHQRATTWWTQRQLLQTSDEHKLAKEKEARRKDRERRRKELEKEQRAQQKAEEKAAGDEQQPLLEDDAATAVEATSTADEVKPPKRKNTSPKRTRGPYKLPKLTLLNEAQDTPKMGNKEIEVKKDILQETLDSFGIDALVGDTTSGPRVTLFEIRPAAGVRVEKISSLANNFAMKLKAESLRMLTPIPGKDSVGIEVPNTTSSPVPFRGLLQSNSWKKTRATIPIALGTAIDGQPAVLDLARAPHLLIAGATGSGKSVCMNTLILSLLYRFSPDELKLIMVDPKVVEFSGYNDLPHLVAPVITDVKRVPVALRWALAQMEWRYQILAKVGVRNLASFNARPTAPEPVYDDNGDEIPQTLPFLIIIIDELADIMMTAKADVETSLARIAQLARAVGIHAVVATQRPSVNVITGVIKANFPTRIAFQVSSVVDSRTIIDGKGAETLLGRGDMLFRGPGSVKLERTQGALVEDDEIERVVSFVKSQAQPDFAEDIFAPRKTPDDKASNAAATETDNHAGFADVDLSDLDPDNEENLVQKAIQIIRKERKPSISYIQRRLRIGYNRAARIIEILEERGLVGPQVGSAPRQILMDDEDGAES